MIIGLSGFAGVGKSTLTDYVRSEHDEYFVATESAREVKDAENLYPITMTPEIFQMSIMDNELSKLNMVYVNHIKNAVFDRTIVDNLVFAENIFKNINYDYIQRYIENLCKISNRETIYDAIVLIKSSHDIDFIQEKILKDDELRKQTTKSSAIDFIEMSKQWEDRYISLLSQMENLTQRFDIIEHFTKNTNFVPYFENLLKENID